MKDLARDLGMSVATVARAFHPEATVAAATRAAVLSRAEVLGYRSNPLARAIITRRTRIVGILLAEMDNPFYPEALARLTAALQEAGFNAMLVVASPGQPVEAALRLLLSYQPEIAVSLATSLGSEAAAACRAAGTPVLFLNRHPEDLAPDAMAIVCDNHHGGARVADHLIEAGARRPAFMAGQADTSTNAERFAGFRDRCIKRGLPPPRHIHAGTFTYKAGHAAALSCLRGAERPDALFCCNDILAAGVLDAARRDLGLRVPEDLLIAGFDDIALAAWPSYDLSTLRQPLGRIIALAVEQIEHSARGGTLAGGIIRIPGEFIPRGSTARPRGDPAPEQEQTS
ncbi:LacI family DNA-binding transcriptional regulator [Roseomonas sp. ACRSG]|nr:LacI family DNA-binding transcriptional regulator [Roseomonas sp. ACRSG]